MPKLAPITPKALKKHRWIFQSHIHGGKVSWWIYESMTFPGLGMTKRIDRSANKTTVTYSVEEVEGEFATIEAAARAWNRMFAGLHQAEAQAS